MFIWQFLKPVYSFFPSPCFLSGTWLIDPHYWQGASLDLSLGVPHTHQQYRQSQLRNIRRWVSPGPPGEFISAHTDPWVPTELYPGPSRLAVFLSIVTFLCNIYWREVSRFFSGILLSEEGISCFSSTQEFNTRGIWLTSCVCDHRFGKICLIRCIFKLFFFTLLSMKNDIDRWRILSMLRFTLKTKSFWKFDIWLDAYILNFVK